MQAFGDTLAGFCSVVLVAFGFGGQRARECGRGTVQFASLWLVEHLAYISRHLQCFLQCFGGSAFGRSVAVGRTDLHNTGSVSRFHG